MVAGGCGREVAPAPLPAPDPAAAVGFAEELRNAVTVDAMMAHLSALQQIADEHDGNRALGTAGYDASVDYVAGALRERGFDVATPEFEVRLPWAEEPALTVGGDAVEARPLEYTIGTPAGGVAGPLVAAPAEDTPGCTPDDYDGVAVQGAVVLVDRGSCPFGAKQTVAADRGAVAVIIANSEDEDRMGGTLGAQTDVRIPVISVPRSTGERLREQTGAPTDIRLNAGVRVETTRNVIAETTTGSSSDVVMVGAHLDSVSEGPGINDNGSGVAAVLETALQLGSSPEIENTVRFGFWGAEEYGLLGSSDYIGTLNDDELADIALYLNFDMLGSPNPGYFTLDGDQSTIVRGEGVPRVPEGSAGIERTLVAYLDRAGKPAEDSSFNGRSDYDGFTRAGIPAGGLFSGAEAEKSVEQAEIWGGEAGAKFDPNYHTDRDTLASIDRTAMEIHGGGVAYAVGLYAQDQRGRNGVPVREDRTRHQLTAS
ncbi:MAG: M28 family metallopeptidase [Actinomycetota bacterium]|nr:M28 family metallopeptidase [Actinomycetota bacterium]